MKAKVHTNAHSRELTGVIESTEVYNKVLLGEIDWKDEAKRRITKFTIPAAVFLRLLEQDRMLLEQASKGDEQPTREAGEPDA